MNRYLTATVMTLLVVGTPAAAQTAPMPTKAEKTTGVRYFAIETITAKPGARLWTIVSKHFIPAAKAAGVPIPVTYHTETGPSQTIIVTPLPGGLADMEWQVSPDDVKWMAALAKQEGGPDKAMALWKEYTDGIATRSREILHEHTD